MSVKRNSLEGLKTLIDIASGTPTGGATDDLGEGQIYVARVVRQINPESNYTTQISQGVARPSRLYKIKLEEELGNSVTGGELLSTDSEDDIKELLPNGNVEQKKAMENFVVNMLPEGIFIGSETAEFPGVGDEVYATSDGGIEGRYLLSLKGGAPKGSAAGYANPGSYGSAGSTAGQFRGENGEPIPSTERKQYLLNFVKQDMVREAVEIRSDFGGRTHPETGEASKAHYGVDVATNRKHAILRAPQGGTVTVAKFQGETSRWKNGNYVKIRHEDGTESIFLHLHTIDESIRPLKAGAQKKTIQEPKEIPASQYSSSPFSQRKGEERAEGRGPNTQLRVKKGDIIGTIGTSGSSTGIHLHWQFSSQEDPYAVVFEKWKFPIA
jgi:hypothetical protein